MKHFVHTHSHGLFRQSSFFRQGRPAVIQGYLQRAVSSNASILAGNGSYRTKRGAYLQIIRDARDAQDEKSFVNFTGFLNDLEQDPSRSTIAGAILPGDQQIFITAQNNSINPDLIPKAKFSAGYDEYDVEIVKSQKITGMHAEMQLIRQILQEPVTSGWYFAAAGKKCCRVCAGLISAMDNYYADVSSGEALEYAWYDPFVNNANSHPIQSLRPYVDTVGLWNKGLYDLG